MENQSIIKKILSFIANLFKVIIIMILNLIRALFGKSKISTQNNTNSNKESNLTKSNITNNSNENNTVLPDEDNIKANPHNRTDDDNTTNDILLELPKYKLNNLNKKMDDRQVNKLTFELISELIDLELEEIYKEDKFKVKDAPKEIEEKIKELKEKVIPKIVEKINNKKLNTKDEVKKEIKVVLEEELKEKPILVKPILKENTTSNNKTEHPKKTPQLTEKTKLNTNINNIIIDNTLPNLNKDILENKKDSQKKESPTNEDSKKDIYFVAKPRKKNLNIKENKPFKANKQEKVITTHDSTTLNKKMENSPVKMVQNVDTIPKPSVKDNIANAALASTIIAADITRELFSSPKENEKSKEETGKKTISENKPKEPNPPTEEVTAEDLNIPGIKDVETVKEELDHDTKSVEELAELQDKLESKIEQLKIVEKQKEESTKPAQDVVKDLIKDTEISAITQTSEAIIDDSIQETKKEEFEDKDYDRIERQIDKMLEDISNTYLRYEDKMSPKQKAKLEAEETKLRNTREQIRSCKDKDIAVEQRLLEENIKSSEINGLQDELKRLDEVNKLEANEQLLKKLSKMEGMTREQVANVDKRILNKRLRKASFLLEMSSILAFPFIRNKYFFYFTAGLIIDNHFNFINSFFNRKVNKYEPADLSQIRRGQDALNGALDMTYKNLVELDYIEQQALSRYPELAYDPQFIHQVTNLRTKLNQNYNKLMRKNRMMDKYYSRTRQQKKILKKDLKPEHR